MIHKIWEKLTEKVWDEAMQLGVEIGYQAGVQSACNYIDELIASGDHEPHEALLEAIIEDLQGPDEY